MTHLKDLHIKIIACVLGCVLHVYVTSLKRKEKKKKNLPEKEGANYYIFM